LSNKGNAENKVKIPIFLKHGTIMGWNNQIPSHPTDIKYIRTKLARITSKSGLKSPEGPVDQNQTGPKGQ